MENDDAILSKEKFRREDRSSNWAPASCSRERLRITQLARFHLLWGESVAPSSKDARRHGLDWRPAL